MAFNIDKARESYSQEEIERYIRNRERTDVVKTITQDPDIPERNKKTFIEKVGSVLGPERIGTGLGLAAFRHLTPEGRELEKAVKERTATPQQYRAYADIYEDAPTAKQVAGSGIRTATTIASAGIPVAKGLAPRIAIGGAQGAIAGGTGAMIEDSDWADIPEDMGKGAIAGSLLAGLTYGLEKGAKRLGDTMYKSLVRYSKTRDKSAKHLISKKIVGTLDTINKKLGKQISSFDKEINSAVTKSDKQVRFNEVIDSATQMKKAQRPELQRFVSPDQVGDNAESALSSIGYDVSPDQTLSMREANELRKAIDRNLGDSTFLKSLESLPQRAETLRLLRNSLSEMVKTNVPGSRDLFAQYAPVVQSSKAVAYTKYRVSGHMPITFFELGGLAVDAPKTLGVMTVRRLMKSGALPSLTGAVAEKTSEVIGETIATPLMQQMILNSVNQARDQ